MQCVNMGVCMLECVYSCGCVLLCIVVHLHVYTRCLCTLCLCECVCMESKCRGVYVCACMFETNVHLRARACFQRGPSPCAWTLSGTHMLLIKSLEPRPGAGVSHTRGPMPHSRGACPTRK